jgi:cyclopropane-fatty-acyl-phospholipid synthase
MEQVRSSRTKPITIPTERVKDDFYEVDSVVWKSFLGPMMKYSSSIFPSDSASLVDAEISTLEDYIVKAGLNDGQNILDLGCGHGSTAIYVAKKFPKSRVTALTMSQSQVAEIRSEMERQGLENIVPIFADMATYEFPDAYFDRILAIEVVEYIINFELFFAKISRWLKRSGLFFVQTLNHRHTTFEEPPELEGVLDGSRYLSSVHLLHFQQDLALRDRWCYSGTHAGRTNEAWMVNFRANEDTVRKWLAEKYGDESASIRFRRTLWRFAFKSELFCYDNGNFVGVGHLLFQKTH